MKKSLSFIRGQTMTFIMELPATTPEKAFQGWTMLCHARRLYNPGPSGLIAALECAWANEEFTAVNIQHNSTDDWPVGPAEFDVLFTSPDGATKVRSLPVRFQIESGITA